MLWDKNKVKEWPWEKDQREYEALSEKEKTWSKLNKPARSVHNVDVGRFDMWESFRLLKQIKEGLNNGS